MRVKNLLSKLGYEYELIELDTTGTPAPLTVVTVTRGSL